MSNFLVILFAIIISSISFFCIAFVSVWLYIDYKRRPLKRYQFEGSLDLAESNESEQSSNRLERENQSCDEYDEEEQERSDICAKPREAIDATVNPV